MNHQPSQEAQVFNLLNLKYSETTALFMLMMIGQLLSYVLWGCYSATSQQYQQFVNPDVVWRGVMFCVFGMVIGLGWLAICLHHRHAAMAMQRRLLVGGLVIFLMVMLSAGWLSGLFAMSLGVVLAGTPFIGIIMFPASMVLLAAAFAWLVIAILAMATIYWGLPYAPLFKEYVLSTSPDYARFYFMSQVYFVLPFLLLTIGLSVMYLKQAGRRELTILRLSQTDDLTQLYNRRTAQELLMQILARPEARPVAVVFLDLDFFKNINDTHGHLVGDRVLVAVATVLRASVRQQDLVARFGGEEFLLVLDGMNCHGAQAIAERCRQQIAVCRVLSDSGVEVPLSASFGVSCGLTGRVDAVDELFRQADQALYQAKANGRNQVIGHACSSARQAITHPLLKAMR